MLKTKVASVDFYHSKRNIEKNTIGIKLMTRGITFAHAPD